MSRLSELDPFRTSTKPSHKSPSSKDTSNIPQSPRSSNTTYTSSFLNNQAKNLKFTYPTTYKPNHITSFSHQKTSNNDLKKHPISYQNFSLKYTPPKSQSEKVTPIKVFTPLSSHQSPPFTPKKSTNSYKKFQPKGLSYLEMTQPFAQSYSHSSHTPREEIKSLKSVEIEIKDRLANIYSVKHSPASSPWIKTLKSPSSSQGTPQLRAQTINTDILRISLEKQLDQGFKRKKPSSHIGTPTRTDMSDFAESIISQFEHRTKIIEQSENLISKYSSPKAVGYNKHLISKKNSTNSSALHSPKASLSQNVNKQIDFDIETLRLKESENNTPQKKQWSPLPEDEEVLYLDPEGNDQVIKENSKEEQESRSLKGIDLSRESPEPSNKTSTLEVLFDVEKKDKTVSSKEIITSELPTPEFSKVLISRSGSMNIYDTLKKRKPSHLKLDSKNLESSQENSKDEDLKKPSLGSSSPDVISSGSSPLKNKVQSIDNIQQAILKESFVEEEEEVILEKRGGVSSLRVEQPQQMRITPRFPSGRDSKKGLKKSESLENKDMVQDQEAVLKKKNSREEVSYVKRLSEKLEEKLMELQVEKPEDLRREEETVDFQAEGLNVSLGKDEGLCYEEPVKAFVEERNENKVEEDFENNNEETGKSLKEVGSDQKEDIALAPESSLNKKEEANIEESKENVTRESGGAGSQHSNEREHESRALEFGNKSNIFEENRHDQEEQVNIEKNSLAENQGNSQQSESASALTQQETSPAVEEEAEKVIFESKEDGLKNTQQVDSREKTIIVESKLVKEEILAFEEIAQNDSINISQELPHMEEDSHTENQSRKLENKDIFVQNSENNLVKANEDAGLFTEEGNHIMNEKMKLDWQKEEKEEEAIEANQVDSHGRFSEIVPVQATQLEVMTQNKPVDISEEFIREEYLHAEENPGLRNEGIKTRAKASLPQSSEIRLTFPKQETNMPAKGEKSMVSQAMETNIQKESGRVDAKQSPPEEKAVSIQAKQETLSLRELAENESINVSPQELAQEGPLDGSEREPEDKSGQNAENDFVLRGGEIVSSQDTTPANEEGNQIREKVEEALQKENEEKDVQQVGSQEKATASGPKPMKEEVFLMEELVQNESVDISQRLVEDESVHFEEKACPEKNLAHLQQEISLNKNITEERKTAEHKESENAQEKPAPLQQAQAQAQEEMINFEEFSQAESINVSQELAQEQPLENETIKLEPETGFTLLNSQIVLNKGTISSPNKTIALTTETHFQQLGGNVSEENEAPSPEENLTFFEFKLPQSTQTPASEEPIQRLASSPSQGPQEKPNRIIHKNPPKSLQISPEETPPVTPKGLSQNTQQGSPGGPGVPLFHSQSQETPSPKPKRGTNQKPKSSSNQYKSLCLDLPSHSPEQHNTPTRPQEIALLSSVVINDSPKKVSLMKKGIIVMDDNMTEGSNHQEDPNFCKEYYTDSRVSESCSFQDIDESSQHSPSRCELISFEEFSVVPKDNRKSQTSPKRPNIQFYYEEKSPEKIEKKRSKKESIEINVSQIPFNISNTAFSAFSGDFNVSSVTKNEQEASSKNLSLFMGEQQQAEISNAFDQNISPIHAPRFIFSQELGRKLSTFALSQLEGRVSNLQASEGEKGGFLEPKSLGNSGEFQRVVDKESKGLMKQISTLESIDRESDHSVNVDSFILPSNLSLAKTQELKVSTGDFDIQGEQGDNESQTSSPEISFNGGKSVIPMMKFENLKTEFENINLTGSIIVFDNNLYYANNAAGNNKELEKRPLDDLNPVTEERSLEMTQSEETKSEAKTDSLTEAQKQEENDPIVINKTGSVSLSFPKIQQELRISTEDLEEDRSLTSAEKSLDVGNGAMPIMRFEDLKTDFNKISLTGSMIVFDNNLYYSHNEDKKELEKQPLDDLNAIIEERSLEMTRSEGGSGEAKNGSLSETEQKQDNELALNQQLAKENVRILQENALEKYFNNLPFPKIQQKLKISSEDSKGNEDQSLTPEKSLEIGTSEISMMKLENFKTNFEKISLTGSLIVFDNNLYYSKDVNNKELETQPVDYSDPVIEERSLEMSQSGETTSEAKGNSLSEAEQQLTLNESLAKENMMILQENALEKYFKNARPSIEMTHSEESHIEVKTHSLIEVEQRLDVNKSLAVENMMILQEKALESYFKNVRLCLENNEPERTNSENYLPETQQQQDNKSLAKENVILLQESALNKYFNKARSSDPPLHKIPELLVKISPAQVELQEEKRDDSQSSTPEESPNVGEEIEKINLAFENNHPIALLNEELDMWALGNLSPVCEEQSCEMICSEANSPTMIQQHQQENDATINKTLAKESILLLQENALNQFFNKTGTTIPLSHETSELKASPFTLNPHTEQNMAPEQSSLNAGKEMTKINLAFENNMSHPNTLRNEEFEMWALGNLSPVCEERSCEITCSEANSPTTTQKPQQNDSNTNKTLTKENVILLQEDTFKKRNSKKAESINLSPPKTQDFIISNGDLDLQEVHDHYSSTPGKSPGVVRSPVPMMKFENLKTDFEDVSLTGSIIIHENQLPPVTEERSLEAPLTATFRKQQQDDDEILLLNKTLAKENVLLIQENALSKYFNNRQPSIPDTMTFRSKAVDIDHPLHIEGKSPVKEELQERKSNPKVLKPLMSFGGTEEDEEEAKSIVLPTDPSALENRGLDTRNLSDISEAESLNSTPKKIASPLSNPKPHETDSEALKESIFLNSHSPNHHHTNTQEDERLPTFGSSILKQPTIPSFMSSNPEKPLSDNNQSISGSTESHNDSPTKQSQSVKFRNSSIFKGFTMAQTLMMTPDLGFSSPMSIDKGTLNQPPTLGRHTSVPSDQDSNHKRPNKMSSSTSNLFRLTPLDGTVDLLEERKSIDTRGSQQRSLQYEKTKSIKSIRQSFLHKNLLQSQFSTEEIIANNSHNKHRTGGQNRENLSNNTAKSSGEVSERFSLSDISLSMLQNEELNLSNNGDISGEIAPQEDFLKSLNFNDSLLLPTPLTRNGSLEDLQYDISAVYNENIGRIETYKKLGNIAGCIKLLKELAHEIEKQEKEEGKESPDSQKEMINYKFYKIQIYNMLSLEHYEMKSYEEALDFTNKVIELDRYNIQALYKSYQIHVKLKKEAEAKSILKRVRKLMQFQPMSSSFQNMKLDNISIPSALSSSTNGSFYEGLQNMGNSLAFYKMNGGDWGKSLSRFKLQHLPSKNDQASNSGN